MTESSMTESGNSDGRLGSMLVFVTLLLTLVVATTGGPADALAEWTDRPPEVATGQPTLGPADR
ncbi:MAG: hypothetical protein ACFCVK_13730 [Acidimicrobiales bacterium]